MNAWNQIMSSHNQPDQNQIFWFEPLTNLFQSLNGLWAVEWLSISWVFKCFPIHTQIHTLTPDFSKCVICVCVWVKAFSVIDFVSHQVIMWVVLCMFSARHCSKQKALNPIWLPTFCLEGFLNIFDRATSYENKHVCPYCMSVPQTTDVVYLSFHSLPLLPSLFFPPIPRPDFKHMFGNDR